MNATKLLAALLLSFGWLLAILGFATASVLLYLRDVHGPTLTFPYEKERLELSRDCATSTDNLEDLVILNDEALTTRGQAKAIISEHGSAIIRDVLTNEVAQELRSHVMNTNVQLRTNHSGTFVPEPDNRYSINLDKAEPSVQKALKQIGGHVKLRHLIDDILGPSATLINLDALIIEYGAEDQDVDAAAWIHLPSYPNYFVPEYTVVLALGNSSNSSTYDVDAEGEGVGATRLCPGTQHCFTVSGASMNRRRKTCNVRAHMSQGDAVLYSNGLHHAESGHSQPGGAPLAYMFLTFAGTRRGKNDTRQLPLGQPLALNWDMWGHTIDEFDRVSEWRWWHSFGLSSLKNNINSNNNSTQQKDDNVTLVLRPWTVIDNMLQIFAKDDQIIITFPNKNFSKKDFEDFAKKAIFHMAVGLAIYAAVTAIVFLLFLAMHVLHLLKGVALKEGRL
jgi:hypothetical protein